MKISIIGSGKVGGTLANCWASANHQVFIGVRGVTDEKKKAFAHPNISLVSLKEAASSSDVIVFALPPDAVEEVLVSMGDMSNKVIIDTMNSVRSKAGNFNSIAEALRVWTKSEDVVKCFNTIGFNIMANPLFGHTAADLVMAGNSGKAKGICTQLSRDLGFNACYDLGGDNQISLVESFAMVWIQLAIFQGQGREIAFSLMKR